MDTNVLNPALQAILTSLSPEKLKRLTHIITSYPGVAFHDLPERVRQEVYTLIATQAGPPVSGNHDSRPLPLQSGVTDLLRKIKDVSRYGSGQNGHRFDTPVPPVLDYRSLKTVLGTDTKTGREVAVSQQERRQGIYVTGVTGSGKSTLLAHLIHQDMQQGLGVCVIEPHGELVKTVLSLVPKHRVKDVILLDLMDSSRHPFSLNLFQCDNPRDMNEAAKTASFVMHVFEKVWHVGTDTPRLQQVLRNITRTMIDNPGMTFAEIPLLLWDDTVRDSLVKNVKTSQTRLFWQHYSKKISRDREELIASTMNKVDAYLSEPIIANIVSQSASSINLRTIMDEAKILLVNLSPQLEEVSRMLGALLIGRLLLAAFSRADVLEHNPPQFNVYVDEFHRFATSDWKTFIEEARKFRVAICAANQSLLSQLEETLRPTATSAGTLVVFRVSGDDSKVLARSYDATPTQTIVGEEPIRATPADPIGHLVRHGSNHPTVAKFVAAYLMPLESLSKKHASAPHPFGFGCTVAIPDQVKEGHRQLNECFATCMREGRSDVFLPPLALFILGGAADGDSTYVFKKDLRYDKGLEVLVYFLGFYGTSNYYGKPTFLAGKNEQAAVAFLRKMAKTSIFTSRETVDKRVGAFTRMLKSLRTTLAILATDPIRVDTGQFQPKYQLRTFADEENRIANDLSQQPDYTARVKLLRGECVLQTHPLPPLLSEDKLQERIAAIKQRMASLGYTKSCRQVEQEVEERQAKLRERPVPHAARPTHPNGGRRNRGKPLPTHT